MIETYFIAGYAIREPYINRKMRKRIDENPALYERLSKTVVLILINDERILLKSLYKLKEGVLYHKYSSRTNWYKFSHAIFRLKDVVKMFLIVDNNPEHFVGKYISYNTLTKKWVYTNDRLKKPFKLSDYMKDFILFNLGICFYILPEVFEGSNK